MLLIVLACLTATTCATEAHDNVAALVDNAKSMSLRTGTVSTVDVLSGTDPVPSFATSMCFQASWAVAPLVKVIVANLGSGTGRPIVAIVWHGRWRTHDRTILLESCVGFYIHDHVVCQNPL